LRQDLRATRPTMTTRRYLPQKQSPANAGLCYEATRRLLNLSFHFGFDATVDLTTFLGRIVRNRAGLAVTYRVNTSTLYAILVNQNLTNRFCTTLGQTLVVLVGTHRVSVTFNSRAGLRILLHEVSKVLDVAITFFANARLIEVELDVQLDAHQFRSRFRLAVHDRSRRR